MQQIFANRRVCAHGEGKLALGACETPSALNDPMPEGIQSLEGPSRGPFGKSPGRCRVSQHLYFAGQVVSHHGAKSKYLVTCQSPRSNNVEAGIVLGISEDGFLRATPIVEHNHALCRFGLVCDDDLVVVIEIAGFEQMQLQWAFVLLFGFLASEYESVCCIPRLGFPLGLKA